MITAKVLGGAETVAALRSADVDSAVQRSVTVLAIKMTNLVKTKLGGEVLNVRTGRLRRSINYSIDRSGSKIEATIGTNVIYGKTHELGLTIPAHIVEAKNAKALMFNMGGKIVFAKRVQIPDVKMPKRSFLAASLAQMSDEVRESLTDAVRVELQKAVGK